MQLSTPYAIQRTNRLNAWLLVMFASLVTISGYLYIAIPDCLRAVNCFQSNAPAPFRYRILQYVIEAWLAPSGHPANIVVADIVIHSVCVVIVYAGLYVWLTRWTDANSASIGILIVLGTWMLSYYFYLRTVVTVIEMACIVLALLALNRRLLVYAALVIIASLNRETGVFLVLIWAAYHADGWHTWAYKRQCITLLLTYVAVTIALHVGLGPADHVLGLAGTLQYNLDNISQGLWFNVILAPLWLLAVTGYRYAPVILRRLMWVGVLSLVSIAVGGAWNEIPRLALVVYPLMLPVMLYSITRQYQRPV